MSHLEPEYKEEARNPMLPFIGFVVIVVLGVLAYLASPSIIEWMATTDLKLGGVGLTVFPIAFPKNWSLITQRLVVTAAFFLIFFVILMIPLSLIMKPSGENELDVRLADLRTEKQKKKKKGRR
jgi:hypothetical protein